ncbi:MAG: hypothetical protein ACTSXQ_06580 [Alphaproteobacteria bacterium]
MEILLPIIAVIILTSVGMLPSIIVYSNFPKVIRFRVLSIININLCGCLPYIKDTWTTAHDLQTFIEALTHPSMWMMMYGAAAAGWGLYFFVPLMAKYTQASILDFKIKKLITDQKPLIDEWSSFVKDDVIQQKYKRFNAATGNRF